MVRNNNVRRTFYGKLDILLTSIPAIVITGCDCQQRHVKINNKLLNFLIENFRQGKTTLICRRIVRYLF